MKITGSTKLTGLFGYPVKHTVSPQMHNAAFNALGLPYVYLPFSIHPRDLRTAVSMLSVYGFIGINVTVPHKQTIMPYLDRITKAAKMIGAVNNVAVEGEKLTGHNTDGLGFLKSLKKDAGFNVRGKTMFLLGAGGAGHAVGVQAALQGVKKIFIVDTLSRRAKSLARRIPGSQTVTLAPGAKMPAALAASDLIVNATPLGLSPKDPISIPADMLPRGRLVYDLIYNPAQTKLLRAAKSKGCKTVNGLGMLLYQGAESFQIWTGKKPPVNIMRRAIR